MLTLPSSVRVYLAAEPVDLRRGHDGLVAIVRSEWKLNPFAGHLFVFLGRRLDRVKILVWDRNGFVLYYKRLSQKRFRMPKVPADATRVELDATTTRIVETLVSSGPEALATCKRMVRMVADQDLDSAGPATAEMIARLRMSPEGQEGMSAFLDRRTPTWRKSE